MLVWPEVTGQQRRDLCVVRASFMRFWNLCWCTSSPCLHEMHHNLSKFVLLFVCLPSFAKFFWFGSANLVFVSIIFACLTMSLTIRCHLHVPWTSTTVKNVHCSHTCSQSLTISPNSYTDGVTDLLRNFRDYIAPDGRLFQFASGLSSGYASIMWTASFERAAQLSKVIHPLANAKKVLLCTTHRLCVCLLWSYPGGIERSAKLQLMQLTCLACIMSPLNLLYETNPRQRIFRIFSPS